VSAVKAVLQTGNSAADQFTTRYGVNTVARLLLVICAVASAGVFAADPTVSESGEPPSQPSAAPPPQIVAQWPAVEPAGPSTMRPVTPDPTSSARPDTGAQPGGMAPSPVTANAQPVANKSGRKVLVDDTVTDAQLKRILAEGYKPESQARDNEVNYCQPRA
jgi:hypothetical protein